MTAGENLETLKTDCLEGALRLLSSGYTGYLPVGKIGHGEDLRDQHLRLGGGGLYLVDNVVDFYDHNPGTEVERLIRNGKEIIPRYHSAALERAIAASSPTELGELVARIKLAEKATA